jgi:hypothetical protein
MDTIKIGTNETDSKKKYKKINCFDVARAISTIMVFGVPLIAGTAAIISYGIYKVCRKLK